VPVRALVAVRLDPSTAKVSSLLVYAIQVWPLFRTISNRFPLRVKKYAIQSIAHVVVELKCILKKKKKVEIRRKKQDWNSCTLKFFRISKQQEIANNSGSGR
jgi:hypothetical protein